MRTGRILMLLAPVALAATAADAQGWEGYIEGGAWATSRSSTDSYITEDPFFGSYLSGYASTHIGSLSFAIDGRAEFMGDKGIDDVYDTGPVHTGVLGLHLGKQNANTYFGGFAAAGMFDGYDSESPMDGFLVGLEVEHFLPSGGALYAQLGYGEAIGDPGDNEFKGYNLKVGMQNRIAERLSLGVSLETAYSPNCFEDCNSIYRNNQWGRYSAATVEIGYELNERVDLVGAFSYASIMANEEDAGESANIYLGIRVPLGNRPKSALRTPMGVFHGAGWMYPLD